MKIEYLLIVMLTLNIVMPSINYIKKIISKIHNKIFKKKFLIVYEPFTAIAVLENICIKANNKKEAEIIFKRFFSSDEIKAIYKVGRSI